MTINRTKVNMKHIIIKRDMRGAHIGENNILKEFEEKQYIPTCVDEIINDKVDRDYETIKKAIELLIEYRAGGLTDFDRDLDIVINNIESTRKACKM